MKGQGTNVPLRDLLFLGMKGLGHEKSGWVPFPNFTPGGLLDCHETSR